MSQQWKSCAHPSAVIEPICPPNSTCKKKLFLTFVKNEIISYEQDCPTHGRCSCQNKQIVFAVTQFWPFLKQVRYACWRGNTKHPMNCTPEKTSTMTIKEKMLDGFKFIQKQQTLLPFQFLLARLSFVKITPLFRNHMKILFFRGIFICHISCVTFKPLLTRNLYIEFTEKDPFLCKPQTTYLTYCWA